MQITAVLAGSVAVSPPAAKPVTTDVLTADPAAFVSHGSVCLLGRREEAEPDQHSVIDRWIAVASGEMGAWERLGSPRFPSDHTLTMGAA